MRAAPAYCQPKPSSPGADQSLLESLTLFYTYQAVSIRGIVKSWEPPENNVGVSECLAKVNSDEG